jgi:hypothetical protein
MPKAKAAKRAVRKASSRTTRARRKTASVSTRKKTTRASASGARRGRAAQRNRKQSKLTQMAVAIGSALGTADRTAHEAVAAVKKEITDQFKDALR